MSASRVLVYGGRGALGSAVVDFFKSKSWVRLYGGCTKQIARFYL